MSRNTHLEEGAAGSSTALHDEHTGQDVPDTRMSDSPDARRIVASASRAAMATDPHNRITSWNRVATELLGRTEHDVIGHNLQDVLQAHDVFGNRLCSHHCAFHSIVRNGDAPESFDLDVLTAEGKKIRVAVTIVVVLSPIPGDYSLVYLLTPKRRRRRADEAIDRLLAERGPAAPTATGAEQRGRRQQPRLTTRQKEVLALMVLGRNSSEMAEELGVSVHTVRSHVQAVLKALEVSNRIEAVSRALSERML